MSKFILNILSWIKTTFFEKDILQPVVAPVAPVVTPPVPAPVAPPTPPSREIDYPILFNAIMMVESGGDDNAEGDKTLANHAYGCLQIRQGVCDQVNAKFGIDYISSDCLGQRGNSIDIWNKYWKIFTFLATDEDKAKGWNGGPYWKNIYDKPGYNQYSENINNYWTKVQKYL